MAKRSAAKSSTSGPGAWLAAFGKHPGWNDHIDDLGVDTQRLVTVKRLLYYGISGVIDSGAWEALDAAQRSEGFDHAFVWRWPDGLVTGRMWSSSDGRGRKKYPMIVCAQTVERPWSFVSERVLPRLRQLEAECRAADTAATVVSLVDAARRELQTVAAQSSRVGAEAIGAPGALATLAESAVFGPDRQGLHRALYQVDRDCAAYIVPDGQGTRSRSRTMDVRPQHVRVPRISASEADDIALWMRALYNRFDPLVPTLFIAGPGAWIDVVVGEPNPTQLQCLQSTEAAIPIASEIPYELDAEFVADAESWIERSRNGEPAEHDPGYVNAPRDRIQAASRSDSGSERSSGNGPVVLAAVAAIVLLAVAAALFFVFGGGGGGSEASDGLGDADAAAPGVAVADEESAESTRPSVAPSGGVTADDLRFAAWSDAADAWLLAFVAEANVESLRQDPTLSATLVPLIERARSGEVELDPRRVVEGAPRSRAQLAAQVRAGNFPEGLRSDDASRATSEAMNIVDGIDESLRPESWSVVADAQRVRELLVAAGSDGSATQAIGGAIERLRGPTAESRFDAIAFFRANAGLFEDVIAAAAADDHARITVVEAADDPILGDASDTVRTARAAVLSSVDDMDDLRAAPGDLTRIDAVERELRSFIEDGWGQVDGAYFRANSRVHEDYAGASSIELLRRWLVEARDPDFREPDRSSDPRTRIDLSSDLASTAERLHGVESGQSDELDVRLAGLERNAEALSSDVARLEAMDWTRSTAADVRAEADRLRVAVREHSDRVLELLSEVRENAEDTIALMRDRDDVSQDGLAVVDEAWRSMREDVIAAYERDGDAAALDRRATELEATLVNGFEASIAGLTPPAAPPGTIDERAFARGVESERERRIAEMIERAEWDGTAFDRPGEVAGVAEQAHRTWLAQLDGFARSFAVAAREIAGGAPIDAEVAGESLRRLLQRWEASELSSNDAFVEAFGGVAGVLRAMVEVDALPYRDAVVTAAESASNAPFPVTLTAWRKLDDVQPAWPQDAGELRQERAIRTWLAAETGRIRDADRRATLERELARSAVERWNRCAAGAESRDGFSEVLASRAAFGVSDEDVAPIVRLNVELDRLRDLSTELGVAQGEEGEIAARDALDRCVPSVIALVREIHLPADDRAWLDAITALHAEDPSAEPPFDPEAVGPARAGWSLVGGDAGIDRLTYRWTPADRAGADGRELSFVRVEGGDGVEAPFYICNCEAPVWLLSEVAASSEVAAEVVAAIADVPEATTGPRTWTPGVARGAQPGWPDVAAVWMRDGTAREAWYFSPELSDAVGTPSASQPLNRVSPVAAALLARSMGCRLPTATEWQAAANSAGLTATPGSGVNLRDQTWASQQRHVAANHLGRKEYPERGQFVPDGADVRLGPEAETFPTNDGALWFWPTDSGDGLRDMFGNVAEWVVMSAPPASSDDVASALAGDAGELGSLGVDFETIERAFGREARFTIGVIGGSALSAPELPLDAPLRWMSRGRTWAQGYADVGFRPVFAASGRRALAPRVRSLFASAPFVRPER